MADQFRRSNARRGPCGMTCLLVGVAAVVAIPAQAAEVAIPAVPTDQLDPETGTAFADASQTILVTGRRLEYGIRSTSTATKTDTNVRDIPQALSVISEAQIEDQNLRSIAELLTFVPGATPGTGESNRDQMTLRGNNTTADFFVDGIRDDVQYFRDFYNVDRVEVLKGPNAMIFGRGGGGGVVNRVIKRSTFATHREALASSDSFGGFRLTGDIDQPLSDKVGLRFNGLYENGDSFRRHVDLKRYGFNPTAGFLLGSTTRIDVAYEYFHDRRTTDRGLPSIGGERSKVSTRPFSAIRRKLFPGRRQLARFPSTIICAGVTCAQDPVRNSKFLSNFFQKPLSTRMTWVVKTHIAELSPKNGWTKSGITSFLR